MTEAAGAPGADRAARWRWAVLVGGCLLLALWITFSPRIHATTDSDDAIRVLASLYHWTPFMWQQDRFGMLIPLLAAPVRNPHHNFLLQLFLSVLTGLLSVLLLVRLQVGDERRWPWVAGLAVLLWLGLCPFMIQAKLMAVQCPYNLSFFLGLAGMLAWVRRDGRRARALAAVLLLLLAHWVNLGIVIWLGWILAFRWLLGRLEPPATRPSTRETLLFGLLMLAAFGAGNLLRRLAPVGQPYAGFLPPWEWPQAALELLQVLRPVLGHWVHFLWVSTLLFGLIAWRQSEGPGRTLFAAGVPYLSALGYFGVVTSLSWVRGNQSHFRYLLPSMFLLVVGNALLIGLPLSGLAATSRRRGSIAAFLLLLAGGGLVLRTYGPPSPAGVRAVAQQRFGAAARDVVAASCTHVAGNSWTVYPVVLLANQRRYEAGRGGPVIWGITQRWRATEALWSQTPREQVRLALVKADAELPELARFLERQSFGRFEEWPAIYVATAVRR